MKATIEQVEQALEASGGWQSQAAKMLNVSCATISERIKNSPRLKKKLSDIKARYLDIAETELLKKVKNGDLGAICFYLKCQGKDRGYIEKVYHGTEHDKPVEIVVKRVDK